MAASTSPVVKNLTLGNGQAVAASAFLSAAPSSAITQYAVADLGGDGGYFLLGGVKLALGRMTVLTASQWASLQYVAGSGGGFDALVFETSTGAAWSAPSLALATVLPAPTLTTNNATLDEGQSINAANLIGAILNPGSTKTTEYRFTDKGNGGKLLLGGQILNAGTVYDLTATQLSQLTYVAGAAPATDTVTIQSYNGAAWSAAASVTITIAPPPTVTTRNASIVSGQAILASSLISGVADPAGHAITEYAFSDSGSDGGQLYFNGSAVARGAWITVTPAQLAQLSYVGGAGAGSDSISVKAFDGYVWSNVSAASIVQTSGSILGRLGQSGIESDVARLMVNNSLNYSSMLTILQDAEAGGMTSSKFGTLQTLASLLNASAGISTSTYVEQITQDVIDGNSANAYWNGGASTAVPLGNLSASSSQTQVTELVGEWFLGTDLPSTNLSSVGQSNIASTYKLSTNPLYDSSGVPSYLDVNQGYDGDCYFMASIAEVALQDPTAIENMITNNGNGTYGVRFLIDGQPDYVTVNAQLANMSSGQIWANRSTLEFANGNILWPELLEKAFAQLNAQTDAPHGGVLNSASDSYAGITAGDASVLSELTGQSVSGFSLNPSTSSSTLSSDNAQLAAAFSAKQELLVATANNVSGNLVADHMFEVTGYSVASNPLNDILTLHNPWGSAASSSLAMTFTETLAALAANDCSIFMTTGKATA